MYKCQQCGEKAEVQDKQDVDQHESPFVSKWVVCLECDYTILKDTADKDKLLDAANEILSDFNQYGEVLQQGDNGEYGLESPIGRLASAITDAEK